MVDTAGLVILSQIKYLPCGSWTVLRNYKWDQENSPRAVSTQLRKHQINETCSSTLEVEALFVHETLAGNVMLANMKSH